MKAAKSTFIYLISSLIEKGSAFLLIPFYTNYLSTSDYGILSIIQAIIGIMTIFFMLSLNGAASRYHFDGNNLYRKFHYGNIFLFVTINSILFTIVLLYFGDKLFQLFGNIPQYPYLLFVIVIVYGGSIFNIYQLKLQMEHKAISYGINNIVKFLLSSSIAIYLIVFLNKKADGVLSGLMVTFIIFLVFIFFKLRQEKIVFNLNKKLLKRNIKYSVYLIPHNLAALAMQFLDRFFISNMLNLAQAGIYSLGGQISMMLGIIASAINNATVPMVLKAYKDENYIYLKELTNISVIFLSIIAIFLGLFSPEIIHLVSSKEYFQAYTIIPILSFYFVLQMYYFMTSSVLFYVESATKFVSIATLISMILNFILNYLLIPIYGIIGASIATMLSMWIVNYIVIFIANKYIKVGFNHLKLHIIIVISFVLSNINFVIDLIFLIKVILFISSMGLLLFFEKNNSLLFDFKRKINEKIIAKIS